ncbi:hypothetical protein [Rugosimonospora africana]|uniref:Uncharacterized protein n=1 Tax=Rugosimonospora africana TaxID=556532 RepID=A0A8J3QUJ5_9ACTN|nr:hypothetical protein [Rugosimonospora africana]GIH17073.1 hypothetical protein Raf01_52450 [Rugosimonospora africana]
MKPVRRPAGRTASGYQKPIGGRVPQADLLRATRKAFDLGQRYAEKRLAGDGLPPSVYYQVYADVLRDLGSVADPVDDEDLVDEDDGGVVIDDLTALADSVAEAPRTQCGRSAAWWIRHRPSRHGTRRPR